MKHYRAFVGYSYEDDDAQVVSAILKQLESIVLLRTDFEWTHAKKAEPRSISEKVLEGMRRSNVYIGICTKREKVAASKPKKGGTGTARKAYWKTSNWLIQEIGLAVGLEHKLILLLENGVDNPGALAADINYISFDRRRPEKVCNELIEMISALGPIPASSLTLVPESQSQAPINEAGVDVGEGPLPSSEARAPRDVLTEELDLPKLQALAVERPKDWQVWKRLAKAWAKFQEHRQAAKAYESASDVATESKARIVMMGCAALQYEHGGDREAAIQAFERLKQLTPLEDTGERALLYFMREFAVIAKDDEMLVGALECTLNFNPSDIGARFALAYKYSQMNNDHLALYHYLRIPAEQRDAATWNNLGVALESFNIPGQAVDAYQKSEAQGMSLASSNLANKLISAGFFAEATAKCAGPVKNTDCDTRVHDALKRIKEEPAKEIERVEELLKAAADKKGFYINLGTALLAPTPAIAGTWRNEMPDYPLEITIEGHSFIAKGSYKLEPSGISQVFARFANLTTPPAPVHKIVTYKGEIFGRTIHGVVEELMNGAPHPESDVLSGGQSEPIRFRMVVSEDLTHIGWIQTAAGMNTLGAWKRELRIGGS